MQIQGNITNIVSDGGYNTDNGYVYTFQMGIQTPMGVYTGQIGAKTQIYPLGVGQPIIVDMTESQHGTRFKKVNPKFAGQSPQRPPQNTPKPLPPAKQPAPQQSSGNGLDKTSFAMAYAKDLVVAGKVDILNMYKVAQSMHEYMTTGKHPFDLPDYDGKTDKDLRPKDEGSQENTGGDDVPF